MNDKFYKEFNRFSEYSSYEECSNIFNGLWKIDSLLCIKLILYKRLFHNKNLYPCLWLALNHKLSFIRNIYLYILCGSWNDIFKILYLDLEHKGWDDRILNWYVLFTIISNGIHYPNTCDLIRNYLPSITKNKDCKTNTLIAKWLARKLFPSLDKQHAYIEYEKLKHDKSYFIFCDFFAKDKIQFEYENNIELRNEVIKESINNKDFNYLIHKEFFNKVRV